MFLKDKFARIHNVWEVAREFVQEASFSLSRRELETMSRTMAAANAEMEGEDAPIVGGLLQPDKACKICGKLHNNWLHKWAEKLPIDPRILEGVFEITRVIASGVICGIWSWYVMLPISQMGRPNPVEMFPAWIRLFYGGLAWLAYLLFSASAQIGTETYRSPHRVAPPIWFYWMGRVKFAARIALYGFLLGTTAYAWFLGLFR